MVRGTRAAVLVGLALLGATPVVGQAVAASPAAFVVRSTADAPDAAVGDGTCASTAPGGRCTLRAAVQEADAAGRGTVVVPAGHYRLTIAPKSTDEVPGSASAVDGATGDLDITQQVTVRGAGADRTTVDGGGLDRVFAVSNTGTGVLSGMTLTGGDPSHRASSQGIALGGAVLNGGAITLERMALVHNRADGGGGMFSVPGTMPVVRDSLVADNEAFSGGGLRLDSGAVITNTTITRNRLLDLPPDAQALPGRPFPTAFSILVDEGTGWGGGIDHRGGDDVVLLNATITDNHATRGGGGLASGQGYAPVSDRAALGTMTLRNTIVAGNTSASGEPGCHVKDQVIASLGHNLASDGTCFLTAAGDRPHTDPRLGRLARNGGPTATQALLPGSPALDGAVGCPAHDQRGVRRPTGRRCDIGAYERANR